MVETHYQPLYQQVHDAILGRLAKGYWRAGDSLPSEFALAEELGVSQGTVRKALNKLVDDNILRRRQGKGTYVAEHTPESALYRFFRYRLPGGERVIPETQIVSSEVRGLTEDEAMALNLEVGEAAHIIKRLRTVDQKPNIFETVVQALSIFPGIDQHPELPDSLYGFYQDAYGLSVVEVKDELRAVSLPSEAAQHLLLDAGTPCMMTERSSINIDGRVIEWSRAYCNTNDFVYSVSLK